MAIKVFCVGGSISVSEDQIVCAEEIVPYWNGLIGEKRTDHRIKEIGTPNEIMVPINRKIFRKFAEKILIVFDPGFSLYRVRKILGFRHSKIPNHYPSNSWWCVQEKCFPKWALVRRRPKYRVLMTTPVGLGESWTKQEEEIGREEVFQRASSRFMVIAGITDILLKRGRINYNHWGPEDGTDETTKCAVSILPNSFALSGRVEGFSRDSKLGAFVTLSCV